MEICNMFVAEFGCVMSDSNLCITSRSIFQGLSVLELWPCWLYHENIRPYDDDKNGLKTSSCPSQASFSFLTVQGRRQERWGHTSCWSPISFADGRSSCSCWRALRAVMVSKSFSSAVFSKRTSSSSSCSSAISFFAASTSVLPSCSALEPLWPQENKETTDSRCDGADSPSS